MKKKKKTVQAKRCIPALTKIFWKLYTAQFKRLSDLQHLKYLFTLVLKYVLIFTGVGSAIIILHVTVQFNLSWRETDRKKNWTEDSWRKTLKTLQVILFQMKSFVQAIWDQLAQVSLFLNKLTF